MVDALFSAVYLLLLLLLLSLHFHRESRGRACGNSGATRAVWRMFHSLFIKIIDRIVYY